MNKKTLQHTLLALSSGLLFSFAWPCVGDWSPLLFVAFIPLLYLENEYYQSFPKSNLAFFGYTYVAFFTWNSFTTWWIYYSTLFGMAGAIVCNSLFMAVVFYLFHLTRKKVGSKQGYIALIAYWIAWEWLHMQWDLSWPWLTLGNGFANSYKWIQWYEYTGVFGGSLWILAINILLFNSMYHYGIKTESFKAAVLNLKPYPLLFIFIALPLYFSLRIYDHYREKKDPVNIVIVQPNIDPYNEKFAASPGELLQRMFQPAGEKTDSLTDYLVFPETALTENIWENEIDSSYSILYIKDFLKSHPHLKVITGASTYYAFSAGEQLSGTARRFRNREGSYDAFNTALQIDTSDKIQVYHKSKLVVGVEKIPYPAIFKPLESFAIDLGGTTGSLGVQEERTSLYPPGHSPTERGARIAPVICYESIYGEFVTDYIKKGAEVIFIITNDGWWDNTAGHRQHLAYGRLRAIETRRSIARSANTGISCFISQRGDIFQPTPWWEEAVISQAINKNSAITFYVRYGDYIARVSLFLSAILLLWTIVKSGSKKLMNRITFVLN